MAMSVAGKYTVAGCGFHHSRAKIAIFADTAPHAPDVPRGVRVVNFEPILGHRNVRVSQICELNDPTKPAVKIVSLSFAKRE
jgi:hypothetical protein